MKSKYCYPTDLLRRDIKADCPEVDLLVSVNAGHDEEQAGPLGSPGSEAAQPEDDRPLVLLDQCSVEQFFEHFSESNIEYLLIKRKNQTNMNSLISSISLFGLHNLNI